GGARGEGRDGRVRERGGRVGRGAARRRADRRGRAQALRPDAARSAGREGGSRRLLHGREGAFRYGGAQGRGTLGMAAVSAEAIGMKNAFTVDVEDYFQVEGFANAIDRGSWDGFRTRVGGSTSLLLDMLEQRKVRATFFVLGWVARKHPEIVRRIAAAGHEVASHGMSHRLVYTQTPEEFRRETHDAKALLEDLAQKPVAGYRAATYSITS